MSAMQNDVDLLAKIQCWYAEMCNDDWEHTYGVFISNIDNPGWSLKVELKDTYLYDMQFEKLHIQRNDKDDWVIYDLKEGDFQGYGGPKNLGELLSIFLTWAEKNKF